MQLMRSSGPIARAGSSGEFVILLVYPRRWEAPSDQLGADACILAAMPRTAYRGLNIAKLVSV